MKCGVKFCGGCNPRYQRGDALDKIKEHFQGRIEFLNVEEELLYDILLVIGGCTNCCASYSQYMVKHDCIKMWDEKHIEIVIQELERIVNSEQ